MYVFSVLFENIMLVKARNDKISAQLILSAFVYKLLESYEYGDREQF